MMSKELIYIIVVVVLAILIFAWMIISARKSIKEGLKK